MHESQRAPSWHALSAEAVATTLQTDRAIGLGAAEVDQRQRIGGHNSLPVSPKRFGLGRLLGQFRSPLVYILMVAAALAGLLGHLADAAVVLAVVVINALIGTLQEGRAERSMAALRQMTSLSVRVMRGGHVLLIDATELVPGDLMVLAAGEAIAADARLTEAVQLQVAEAALTGESMPVSKSVAALSEATRLEDRLNMVYAGTHITAGRGQALVVATGAQTELGLIAHLTACAIEPKTPLEQRIDIFGRGLVWAAVVLFIVVMLLGMVRHMPLTALLMVAISQMVAMVPEGLPVAMTIALAVGMQRMAAHGAIIRRLSAVETLGSTTVICTDKTGTLTRNEMTVTALSLPQGEEPGKITPARMTVEDLLALAARQGREPAQLDPAVTALVTTAVLCNDAVQAKGAERPHGDPTEVALWLLATRLGLDPLSICREAPRQAEIPFDAETKLMFTSHCHSDGRQRLHIKGAPEAVLRLCGAALDHPAYAEADAMAERALRVLAFCVVEHDPLEPFDLTQGVAVLTSQIKGRAQWLGLMGQIDPPRDEVRPAVAACRSAGIRTVMVTGDHKLTGLAIARELGIARDGDRAVDGLELERMSEAELQAALDHIAVFARVHPAQKLRIVEAFQARGEVVAMTGDGVNDAPALARADVGIAMGLTGTEVAKSAARIVITDDNFATIVSAVEQGRVVYGNLKKLILYLFATALAEVLVLLLALLSGLPLPLAAVQILWINIVTEGTVTVNLVMDPPDGDEMRRPPTPRSDPLISRDMLHRVLLMTPMITAVSLGWFVWRLSQGVDEALVRTETFTLVALCAWFNVLNCQSATRSALRLGVLRNRWLLGGLGLSVLLQGAVLTIPAMNALFHTQPLPLTTLGVLLAAASSVLWAEELRKAWARKAFSARLNEPRADA